MVPLAVDPALSPFAPPIRTSVTKPRQMRNAPASLVVRREMNSRTKSLLLGIALAAMATLATAGGGTPVARPPEGAVAMAAPMSHDLRVEQRGERIVVHIESDVDADLATVAATLSDYDRLPQFIPSMVSSRTVMRNGREAVVSQEGVATYGLLRQSFALVLDVREDLPASIVATGIGGDFKSFAARYDIVSMGPRLTRVTYQAEMEPNLSIPTAFTVPVMRSIVATQFEALVQEARRRGARGG